MDRNSFGVMNQEIVQEEKETKKNTLINLKQQIFEELLLKYPCLMNKSQKAVLQKEKRNALVEIGKYLQTNYGITSNMAQIRRKIENLKCRLKRKMYKKLAGNHKIKFKPYQKKVLDMIYYKNKTMVTKVSDDNQIDISGDSVGASCDMCDDDDVEYTGTLFADESGYSTNVPSGKTSSPSPINKINNSKHQIVLELQQEVLEQQKELYKEEKVIKALQKEKLLLEIQVLKNKLCEQNKNIT